MDVNFCRRCGGELTKESEHLFKCDKGHSTYLAASPTVGIFFTKNNKIVLSVRAIEPRKGELDTIGGFVDYGENFEQAIIREIEEETGLVPSDYGSLSYLTSAVSTYPYEGEVKEVLSVFFYAELFEGSTMKPQDDVEEFAELSLDEIDRTKLTSADVLSGLEALEEVINQ